MKKLAKLSLLVFIPIIAGVVCLIAGSYTDNGTLAYVGTFILTAGIPATMFILVVVGLVLMMTGRLGDYKSNAKSSPNRDDTSDRSLSSVNTPAADVVEQKQQAATTGERNREMSDIEAINSTYGAENRRRLGEYEIRHVSDRYKKSTSKEKVLGWLFFAFLITDFALILVFAFCGIMIGALVCFCIFGGTIIISLIVTKIVEHRSMRVKLDPSKKQNLVAGVVRTCVMSSSTSTGGSKYRSTERIVSMIYRVTVTADGKDYTAYTDKFYETGESVAVIIIGKRSASIVSVAELREKTAEIKAETEAIIANTAEIKAKTAEIKAKTAEIKAETAEIIAETEMLDSHGDTAINGSDEIDRRIAERRAQGEKRMAKKRAARSESGDENRSGDREDGEIGEN